MYKNLFERISIRFAFSNPFSQQDLLSRQVTFPAETTQSLRTPRSIIPASSLLVLVLLGASLLMAACGPQRNGDNSAALMESTRQIAIEYRASGNLEQAKADLGQLDVANANQWLIFVTESAISDGDPQDVVEALVRLVYDLGLHSAQISRYALAQGLPAHGANIGNQLVAAANPQAGSQESSETGASNTDQISTPSNEEAPTATAKADSNAPATNEQPVQSDPPATPTSEPATATPVPVPQLQASSPMNVRGGPGTNYPIVNALPAGQFATIVGKNPAGDWWQVELGDNSIGWVYGPLVETDGPIDQVVVAASIPTPPPATATPVPQPTEPPAPVQSGPDFRLVERRLWDVVENGGHLAGDSVNCGNKHEIHVLVTDANGNPLNGVAVQGVYTGEIHVTGAEGKGDGRVEYVMFSAGEDVKVIRDVDGREVTSDVAVGQTTRTKDIPFSDLIQGRFCKDDASCQAFVDTRGCFGHFSWTVVFQRSY